MTIQHLYPTTRPSLDLNFARQKRLDPRVTFTRGSTATYVGSDGLIKTAASNEARFDHDPATGESLGLLIEESRTNLLTYSEEFDNAAWVKANVSITANSTTAPDGTSTADTLNCSSGGQTFQHIRKSATTTAASYTFSCFIKAGNINTIRLGGESYTIYATFTLTGDGSYSSVTSGASASIVPFPNGWYRCTLTYTASSGTYVNDIRFSSAALNDYVYIWGAQLESGSFPTSYIPTSGSTVTRSADVASMTGTNFSSWYNSGDGEGTMFVDYRGVYNSPWTVGSSASPRWLCGWGNNKVQIYDGTNATSVAFPGTYPTLSSDTKEAVGLGTTSMSASRGGLVSTANHSASITGLYGILRLDIGLTSNIGRYVNGPISRLTYYPYRLTDAQLQALTL